MKKEKKSEAEILRQKAKEVPNHSNPLITSVKITSPLSENEMMKLIHELEVHQIELEMQNDELQCAKADAEHAKADAEHATKKYTDLYNFSPSGYVTLSKFGEVKELNITCAKMCGIEWENSINSMFGFFVSTDTLPIFNLFLNKVFQSKSNETCEVTFSKDGDLSAYVLLTGIVTDNKELCNVTMVDITERKHAERILKEHSEILEDLVNERTRELREEVTEHKAAEQRLNTLIQAAPICIHEIDLNGQITSMNRTGLQMLEMQDVKEICGLYYMDFVSKNQKVKINQFLEQAYQGEYNTFVFSPEDSKLIFSSCFAPVLNNEGVVERIIGLTENITERMQAEVALQQSEKQLHQSQKVEAIGRLTGGIAHDFNNILGIITGYVGLAKKHSIITGDTKQTKYLDYVAVATFRAANLVSKMLAFVRKNEDTNGVPVYLQSVLKDEHDVFFTGLPSSIKINITIDDALPNVLFNITEFDQLLINLVTNARDAMDEVGIIDIRLGWSSIDSTACSSCLKHIGGKWVELSVTDSGSGIESSLLTRIFDPFHTSKEVGKGTGLGLSVTHGIMHSHGGHIVVESKLGIGTTFRLLFPPHIKEHTEVISTEEEITPLVSIKSQNILVVDDEISLTELMGEYLKYYGYKATIVSRSIKALELFKEQPDKFSLIITDQTMPELTGAKLIKQVREIRPNLPAILNSGYSDYMNAEKAAKLNIMYLQKPVELDAVVRLVNELLGET